MIPPLRHEGPTPNGLAMYSPETPGSGFAYAIVARLDQPTVFMIEAYKLDGPRLVKMCRFQYKPRTQPGAGALPASTVTRLLRERLDERG